MQKHFTLAMERIEGLINLWSAPSPMSSPSDVACPRILLAVSGGVDSMCMADIFLSRYGSAAVAVAHCNFHLRGEESDGDEALVRAWADSKGVECHVAHFDTAALAAEEGVSIEMAARDLRYGWFAELCAEYGYKVVAVAHNANDNAETLILNLLRGTGLRGLGGMSLVSDLPVILNGENSLSDASSPRLVRPLLQVTRKQIEGYALAHGVKYREDSTNSSSNYKRNRIRNEVFPLFEKINPSFIRTLNREMGYFSEASDIVDDYCASASEERICGTKGCHCEHHRGVTIPLPKLLFEPHWRYLLYYMLEPYGFNSATIASVEGLLESDRTVSGKHFESPTHELVIDRSELCIRPKGIAAQAGNLSDDPIMVVRAPGIYNFNGRRWQVEILERTPDMQLKQPQGTLIADADKLPFPFVCRRWRQGDWLIPFGMKGRKKVSDLFTDLKFTSLQKEQAVMIVDCSPEMAGLQHLAGVLGVRMDDRYKITGKTSTIVRITILS